jgi:4-amino-4-deoxy-L-arabinose transferase-like glycosyltransferase
LLLRLPGLLALPLFNDEAVYLLRAQRFPQMLAQSPLDSGTLPDGKLLQELALAALAHLPGDPLLPARLLSVACGLGTLVALLRCGRRLGWPEAGAYAGLLYALAPLAQIHDRMAISDSMLTMVGTFVLAASIGYARGGAAGRREAFGLGALIAAAALVKLPGLLFALIPPLAVMILSAPDERWRKIGQLRLSLIVALAALAALAPFHYGGAERQKIGGEVSRLALIGQNTAQIGLWLLRYLPGPLLVLPLAALMWGAHAGLAPSPPAPLPQGERGGRLPPSPLVEEGGLGRVRADRRVLVFLLAAGLAVPGAFAVVGGALASRYILPAWPALLLAAALGAQLLWRADRLRSAARALVALMLGAATLWGGYFALRYSADPRTAPLDAFDRWQYTQSWTAGYALPPLFDRVREIAAGGPITLALHDQSRLASLASQIYLSAEPQIRLASIDLSAAPAQEQLRALAAQRPIYLLADAQVVDVYDLRERIPGLRVVQVAENPDGGMRFWLFRLEP